jgi:hypothetical protein
VLEQGLYRQEIQQRSLPYKELEYHATAGSIMMGEVNIIYILDGKAEG